MDRPSDEADIGESRARADIRVGVRLARRLGIKIRLIKLTLDDAFDIFVDHHDISHLSIGHIETTYRVPLMHYRERLRRGIQTYYGIPLEII